MTDEMMRLRQILGERLLRKQSQIRSVRLIIAQKSNIKALHRTKKSTFLKNDDAMYFSVESAGGFATLQAELFQLEVLGVAVGILAAHLLDL